jgi:hypothetical protein
MLSTNSANHPTRPRPIFFQMIEQLTRAEIDLLSETLGVRSQ